MYTKIIKPYADSDYEVKPMEEIMNDKWISIDEAAEYLDIKAITLRSWIRKGKEGLPAQKIGKQWKFKISELDEWVKSGKSAND